MARQPQPEPASLNEFMQRASDVFQGQGDTFNVYLELRDIYRRLAAPGRQQAGQVLSMVDAMFGRYQDATDHYAVSFPVDASSPKCPPQSFNGMASASSIAQITASKRVLLINESHSDVQTRASVLAMLPVLKRAGFKYLALEALTPNADHTGLLDSGLAARAYVVDNHNAGFYLQEPVYAELIRSALEQGFSLVAYESDSTRREQREDEQASHLAEWLNTHPGERLVVVGGYSHVWKTDGWMAQRLVAKAGVPSVSVDQVELLQHCGASHASRVTSTIWFKPGAGAWSAHPDRVDVTVSTTGSAIRGATDTWLTLGGSRVPVNFGWGPCAGHTPCLIEARHAGESEGVPADRWVRVAARESETLYLTPGPYAVTFRWLGGQITIPGTVDSRGAFHQSGST